MLRELSRKSPDFSGVYVDESGATIISLANKGKKARHATIVARMKSRQAVVEHIGESLMLDLESIYGKERFENVPSEFSPRLNAEPKKS